MHASRMAGREEDSQRLFQQLKLVCVPLLAKSHLAPSAVPEVSGLLTQLIETLREARRQGSKITPSLISYVFFPISTILRRSSTAALPDQILEKLLNVLSILCEHWWWDMDVPTWEQIFMLCSAIVGGLDSKGKGKRRDDETIEAAVSCLWTLLRDRSPEEAPPGRNDASSRASSIFSTFQSHSRTHTFVPIIGQTVNSLLDASTSQHPPLQRASLKLLRLIIEKYLADEFIPSILPGVVSNMCKIALATGSSKRWANGETVAYALDVLEKVTVRALGDDVCIREGAVRGPTTLEELAELSTQSSTEEDPKVPPYVTQRTATWLRGTSSQMHIALNSLNPLVGHPSAIALNSLALMSSTLLRSTTLTLPQSTSLLLSFLLSLSLSEYEDVSKRSREYLVALCDNNSPTAYSVLQTLLQIAKDHLTHLPRLIQGHSDAKLEHSAGVLEAICNLGIVEDDQGGHTLRVIASEVSKLLGPNGGVERWGWSLLSVLELTTPSVTIQSTSAAQLMLESDAEAVQWVAFPEVHVRQVTSRSPQQALERMLRSLGRAAQEDGLFAVEWFFGVGKNNVDSRAAAALWCGARTLEGIAGVSLEMSQGLRISARRKRLEKFARGLAKTLAEIWDEESRSLDSEVEGATEADADEPAVEHLTGLVQIRTPLQVDVSSHSSAPKRFTSPPGLHKALALQSLAICAGILQTNFAPLLLYTLYPVLNALISEHVHLSSTALAALHFIAYSTSYASPANLLLSNFDYALDAVSRRLNRRWLDVDATRVLVVLVRLVGRDVVQKAGDVVEECFDRLDEYHGYEILVDGLVTVLLEVVVVIGTDETNFVPPEPAKPVIANPTSDREKFSEFHDWFVHRHDVKVDPWDDVAADPGPFPRKAWGPDPEEAAEQEASKTAEDPLAEPPPTPTQALTKLIVSRSLYFLTHGSALIRARILSLLGSAVPVLPSSAILPSIHHAWPFILNRLSDPEPFVVRAAAALVESLAKHVGDFMFKRVWEDIWPRFRIILRKLEAEDATNALARRGPGAVGTGSAYTHSHRMYTAILNTLAASVEGVKTQNSTAWEVITACRRFLHAGTHEELQTCAVNLYRALCQDNEDAVWLALSATAGEVPTCSFLHESKWSITENMKAIFE